MPRAPLKKKTAAVFSVFIKYSCCSLEEKKDPLPEKKDIFSITLWWLHIFLCLKAMSFFDWDPEKKIKRGREKSQTGKGEGERACPVSSSLTAVRRKDWKFKPTRAALQE